MGFVFDFKDFMFSWLSGLLESVLFLSHFGVFSSDFSSSFLCTSFLGVSLFLFCLCLFPTKFLVDFSDDYCRYRSKVVSTSWAIRGR